MQITSQCYILPQILAFFNETYTITMDLMYLADKDEQLGRVFKVYFDWN